jgi:RNA polymerase sigma-70 factor (ECF subfamily)
MVDTNRYDEFAHLLQRSAGQIVAYLHALLLNWSDAEDVFQESCLVLWEKFDEFEPGTNFLGWALRVAQNKAMNFRRTRARRARFWRPELQVALMAAVSDRDAAAAGDSLAALAVCMDRLSEGDRRLVQRCYGDRVPVQRIAAELGRSPQSVHNSLRRVRTLLLECIQEVREDEP